MSKNKLLALLLSVALTFSLAVPAFAADEEDIAVKPYEISADVKGKLVILHTNDTHGADAADEGKVIGTAGVAQLKKDFEAAGAEVLLFSAGDAIMGKPLVSESKGDAAIKFMNAAGYDAMTVGNHEMDFGYENLKALVKTAEFSILSATVLDEKTSKPVFEGNKIFTTESGLKVGVFGLSTPETLTKADASKMPGITFPQGEELVKAAQAQVDALKKEKVDIIVCLGHLGVDPESEGNRSIDVCEKVTGIDLFIDGHSHSTTEQIIKAGGGETNVVNGAKIVSTGTALANVGVVVYDKEAKTLTDELVAAATYTKVDETVAKLISEKSNEVAKKYGETFAKTETDLNGSRGGGKEVSTKGVEVVFPAGIGNRTAETNLGDFAADAILWQARKTLGVDKVDAALTNGGGIRKTVSAGDISMLDMLDVFPFGNTVATIDVTGADLLEAMEAATCSTPAAIGAFPQVAGIEMVITTATEYVNGEQYTGSTYYAPANLGSRVEILTVNGEVWAADATYTIATNDFTAKGGDTFYAFKRVGGWKDVGVSLEQALINYTTEELKGVITAQQYGDPQNRIVILPADVAADAWYYEAVAFNFVEGIMKGTDAGFAADGKVTRATVLQTLYNMEDKPAVETATLTDVEGKWYADAANWAASVKLMEGTTFGEDAVITRAEVAQLIADYCTMNEWTVDGGMAVKEAPDYDKVPAELAEGVGYCYNAKIMTGNEKGELNPMGEVSRAEFAQVMMNLDVFAVVHVAVENAA